VCVLPRRAAPSEDASDEKETRACGARRVRGVRPRDAVETRSPSFCPLAVGELGRRARVRRADAKSKARRPHFFNEIIISSSSFSARA
jgi:hypothetical protein